MDWNHRWLCRGVTLYFVLVILVLMLAGCTTIKTYTGSAPFCTVYSPIYWSAKDTRKTKEQVDANNRVWKKMCKK